MTHPRWHGQALAQGVTVEVRTELAPDLPPLLADGTELREMLTNLIFNAVDAISAPGGRIVINTRHDPNTGGDEGSLVLSVGDTGAGMDEATRRRCLEPFFTTKGERGTGLGLAMVYGTVQRHGGHIDLDSAPGRGTTFTFTLPVRAWSAAEALLPVVEAGLPWSILIVDDQPDFLLILERYLTRGGLEVETALSGDAALEKIRGRAFDLVITDKAMPGMGGEELARTIKAMSPQPRVILLTGYSISDDLVAGRAPGIDLVVHKPLTLAALRAAIGKVMVGHRPVRPGKRKKRRLIDLAA